MTTVTTRLRVPDEDEPFGKEFGYDVTVVIEEDAIKVAVSFAFFLDTNIPLLQPSSCLQL